MSYYLGTQIKANLMAGLPTRTKSGGDYSGQAIPPCGEFAPQIGARTISIPPWMGLKPLSRAGSTRHPPSLHDEITMFTQYMEPTDHEIALRVDLIRRFTALIDSFKMNATVQPVGSYVTGLYLPTSDIDMIQTSGFASKVEDVLLASIPLIRITDKLTRLEIDLTAADTHGMRATEAVQKWTNEEAMIKALISVVKIFLAIRRCGTTYTGGVNSYLLVWLVVAWVKLEWPKSKRRKHTKTGFGSANDSDVSSLADALQVQVLSVQAAVSTNKSGGNSTQSTPRASSATANLNHQEPSDFGEALKGFLKFYGEDFDYSSRMIEIEPQPSYRVKTYVYSRYPTQRYLLSIIDPVSPSMDIGEKAYAIKHVQASFKEAYENIIELERGLQQIKPTVGILRKVLGGDFTNFVAKRQRLSRVQHRT